MAARILCIGNRFVSGDDFGPRVYDTLAGMTRPADIEIVDGGLAGLNLLRYLEDGLPIVFVDALSGFAPTGEITVIDGADIARQASVVLHSVWNLIGCWHERLSAGYRWPWRSR